MSDTAPFIDYLKQLQQKGHTHVPLDEQARKILRVFYKRATQGDTPTPSSAQPVAQAQQMAKPVAETQAETPQPAPSPVPAPAAPVTEIKLPDGPQNEQLASLRNAWLSYQPIKALTTLRTKLVFPEPTNSTDIMFISESPGYHDEQQGKPLAGPAGEKLNGILKAMGLSRQQVHITTILKFRPSTGPSQTTDNRPASAEELEAAKPLLDQEIQLLQPKVIIPLGAPASRFFTGENKSIDELREYRSNYKDIPVHPTYSPQLLLNTSDTTDRRKVWQDMLAVMELLGLPISEKQRGYFSKSKK